MHSLGLHIVFLLSIIGWFKEEIVNDFNIKESDNSVKTLEAYIKFFNEDRSAYSLIYLTQKQYKEFFLSERKLIHKFN